ncbi:enoyl-CoA hydratase/isomerase family protein [Qipengyuania zhejiangensis]|uniref:enoyl-CoA hydratase/isomerase family protein n=1 Tax=Qipengyuania zhejiangensis TaxID=3077782 RepID=UPI002D767180|nr:enoyl-CoA hydratase/isomerase family protein [Qipengyuania sp. Z2]
MSHTPPPLLVETRGDVDWVTLNRPARLNSLDNDLTRDLREYFEALYRRRDCRIVVLRGAGRAFCAGLDLHSEQADRFANGSMPDAMDVQRNIRDIMLAMRRCPQPIVCLMHGAAAGGGFVLAMAADIRIAAENCTMNAAFIKIGLGGCDVGASYLLPRLIGSSPAASILFTGQDLSAERAYQLGLVSELVAVEKLEEVAQTYVDAMQATAPEALRMTKQVFTLNIDAPSFEAALALEDRNQVLLGKEPAFHEGVAAFYEKRPPRFDQARPAS